jgi:hypothetical protein
MRDPSSVVVALKKAEDLLASALASLDESQTTCTCCARPQFAAFDEHQMAEQLRGAIGRARRVRRSIATPTKGPA